MKKIFQKKYLILFTFLLFLPLFTVAVETGDDVIAIFSNLLTWIWRMFAIITVMIFIFIGFSYMTSQGNPEKLTIANRWLLYGIIGLAVALLSGGMVALVQSFIEGG